MLWLFRKAKNVLFLLMEFPDVEHHHNHTRLSDSDIPPRNFFLNFQTANHLFCFMTKRQRPRRDSNPQSSDPKSDALSIRPHGQSYEGRDF